MMKQKSKSFNGHNWNDQIVISASISDPDAVGSGEMILWPIRASIQAYEYILQYKEIWIGYANTIFYTVVGTMYLPIT